MGSSKDTGHRVLLGFMFSSKSITLHCVTLNVLAYLRSLGFPVCKVEETLLSALQNHSEGSLRSKQWLLQEASLSLRVWGGNVKVRTWGLKQRYRGRQDDFVEVQKSVAIRNVEPETRGSGKGGGTHPKLCSFLMRCPFFPAVGEFVLL